MLFAKNSTFAMLPSESVAVVEIWISVGEVTKTCPFVGEVIDTAGGLFTIISAQSEPLTRPSNALKHKVYVPYIVNVAVVFVALALPKVTVPGPENFDQVKVIAL